MKLFKITAAATIIFTLLVTGSCTRDYAEVNTNKNNTTSVTPDLLLSQIIKSMMDRQVNEAWGIGNIVVQYHSKIQFVNEDRYGWNERNSVWDDVYSNYRNIQNIFIGIKSDETSPYFGVGLILKSWMFAQVTDAYGDVPYSEAGKAKTDRIYQPVYDKQEDVYAGILADLKKANEVLIPVKGDGFAGDILFGGGTSAIIKWRKLANSLRLRYLMRISKKKDVKTEMQEIVADPAKYPIFENNSDNAVLKYLAAAPNQWPIYGSRVGSIDEFRVSKTLSDRLTALGDPRLKVFGRPTQASVIAGTPVILGSPNGLSDVDALAYNGGVQGVSRVGYTFACLVCNDVNQAPPVPDAAQGMLMLYPELQFILAEARQKGWITTGDVATYYTNGITANFSYWKSVVPLDYKLNIDMPAGYLAQPAVALTGTDADKLAKIALQKWISLYFNGLEGWYDWRRTNMPAVIPGPANLNNNKVPVRFIYPQKEQTLNSKNRDAAVANQGPDNINTLMWVLK
jgi:hypothetical protein